ncbi:MAG TPA: glycine--tRNA ligase subunit beta [Candidatus Acidoferrales bacterium]|jgi:glycyl-tRNA synthetase beta chain|nr:glycine--tRNA ligase subunit beta [Candidatus Acidoferrales bacterium]
MKATTKATADFLFEIGCEEIPAGMLPGAMKELKVILEKYLTAYGLAQGYPVEVYGAPRRLAASCTNLRVKQPDETKDVQGPSKSVAYDAAGKPTRAAEGFAHKMNLPIDELVTISTPKGEYLSAKQVILGRSAKEILEEILPRTVAEIPWTRSMYWTGATGLRFIRPIRWVVALLDGKPLRFTLGDAAAGNISSGHRFLGKARIPVFGAKDYVQKLRANFVLVRPEERKRKIEGELRRLAIGKGFRIHEDARLLDLVTDLNEYPAAILGGFDLAYLELPEEILITVMRDHQKYFALERKDGKLAPNFLAVINLDKDKAGLIRAGHERVLRARFADARFFWETDQKCRLADYLPKLGAVTFQEKLGSYGEKVERIRELSRWLSEQWFASGIPQASVGAADRAAELSKCDLVTEMVREFTELQGIVGGLYAKSQGEPEEVVRAVYDHYKPSGLEDSIPRNITGQTVSLADKFDSLVGCFAVGLVPSGSSDPFALRRAAIGIVKILVETKLPVSLSMVIARAARTLSHGPRKITVSAGVENQVLDFLLDRARFVLKERSGLAYDEINAALAAGPDDLVDAIRRMEAIRAIRKTKNFEPLAVSFKRIRKILEKAGPEAGWKLSSVRSDLFAEEAERELHARAASAMKEVEQHKRAGRYRDALQGIAALRPAVDRFFEDVMVMADDEQVRKNRLTLLSGLLSEFSTIADFSEIVTAEQGK